MQLVSVFGLTAISAIILPYRKKVAHIWDASPFSQWKVLGVPVLTIAGVVYLAYIVALFYFAFLDAHTRDVTGKKDMAICRRLGCGHDLVLLLEVPQQDPGCRCRPYDLRGAASGVTRHRAPGR